MKRDDAMALAGRIVDLINSQPATPAASAIADVILGGLGEAQPDRIAEDRDRDLARLRLMKEALDDAGIFDCPVEPMRKEAIDGTEADWAARSAEAGAGWARKLLEGGCDQESIRRFSEWYIASRGLAPRSEEKEVCAANLGGDAA